MYMAPLAKTPLPLQTKKFPKQVLVCLYSPSIPPCIPVKNPVKKPLTDQCHG